MEHAGEGVAAELVGAGEVVERRPGEPRRDVHLGRLVGRDPGREDGAGEEEQHEDQAEDALLVPEEQQQLLAPLARRRLAHLPLEPLRVDAGDAGAGLGALRGHQSVSLTRGSSQATTRSEISVTTM